MGVGIVGCVLSVGGVQCCDVDTCGLSGEHGIVGMRHDYG